MRRTESEVHKNNNHCLDRKQSPFSLQNSKTNESSMRQRKMSNTSLKQNIPDLEKLIMDIKISPSPDPCFQTIKHIFKSLKQLESNPLVSDEVHAVYLLMQTIQNKLNPSMRQKYRNVQKINTKRDSVGSDQKQLSEVSPIKLINEQTSSRILYTNFSLKDVQKSMSQENSIMKSSKKSVPKVSISKFEDAQNNQEVNKLNQQIKYLEHLLHSKTKGSEIKSDLTLFKKKSCRY